MSFKVLSDLHEIANDLDAIGAVRAADAIDAVSRRLAQTTLDPTTLDPAKDLAELNTVVKDVGVAKNQLVDKRKQGKGPLGNAQKALVDQTTFLGVAEDQLDPDAPVTET
jgi:hypothetical protein